MRAMQIAGLAAIACAANTVLADTVFRSVDDNGQVIYSDRPNLEAPNDAVEINIKHSNTSQIVAKQTADKQVAEAVAVRETHEAEDSVSQEQMQAEVAERRQANCTAAKSRQEKYNTNRKLYKPLPDGGREYLSDDELDAARAEAARTVDEWCS